MFTLEKATLAKRSTTIHRACGASLGRFFFAQGRVAKPQKIGMFSKQNTSVKSHVATFRIFMSVGL
jgi:hypothetical protein